MIEEQEQSNSDIRPWRFIFLGVVILLFVLYIAGQLGAIQLRDDDEYKQRARTQSQRLIVTPAPRGNIYDRYGRLLVGNRPSYNIVADLALLREEISKEYYKILRNDRALIRLNALVDTDEDQPKEEKDRRRLARQDRLNEIPKIARTSVLQKYLDQLNVTLGRQETLDATETNKHFEQNRTVSITLVSDINETELARFVEHYPVESPIRIEVESIRTYPYGPAAAHVLGYLQNIDPRPNPQKEDDPRAFDLENDPELTEFLEQNSGNIISRSAYKFRGKTGATAFERAFDNVLQGTPGYQIWTVLPNGYLYQKIKEKSPVQGSGLNVSLDIDLQLAVEKSLKTRAAQNKSAAIVIDVKTGEALACASAPTFDPNRIASFMPQKYKDEIDQNDGWLGRATQGLYPPGSSFKPITAIAAMRSNVVAPHEMLYCESTYQVGAQRFVEHDRMSFGDVDITRMLKVSCNVFCYQVGLMMLRQSRQTQTPEPLAIEAKRFGLDSKTTFEVGQISEQNLVVPTAEYKRRIGQGGWVEGDTANMAIGQGFNVTTPMHIACMMASIARNETRTAVTIIHDPGRADLVRYNHGGERIGLTDEQHNALIEGLVACAKPGGTGARVSGYDPNRRSDPPVVPLNFSVACKTGTAQVRGKTSTLAWTIAFAPVENPEIALCVMIEGEERSTELGGGSHAGPVANDILAAWDKLKKQQR
ncbi:MAG: hypothetical protein LBV12_12115 [Puniceicoccales bacterium]|jgi:penicillin-binding protein 2|nr:hypothetical protein [Puniceicoccales bacterium]